MERPLLEIKDLIKVYTLYPDSKEKLKSLFKIKNHGKKFYALNGINLKIEAGESIGIIGLNGSGKSTLSNIIAGLVPQTSGEIHVNGTVSLLSIASGLNNELSGRENIELKCLMLGLDKSTILELEPKIIEFSELDEYIDQPVKNYSSGMKSRLGFSISTALNPDVFIVDEALSVGDPAFTEKAINRMKNFQKEGKSILYVSHSMSQIKQFCDKVLWIEAGRIKAFGDAQEVLKYYNAFMSYWKKMTTDEKNDYKNLAYTTPVYKAVDNPKMYLYDLGNDAYNWIINEKKIRLYFISKIVKFNSSKARVYRNIRKKENYQESKMYDDTVYFSKRSAHYQGEIYYLLSRKQSYKIDLLGWVNIKDLKFLDLMFISDTKFSTTIKKGARTYTKIWGGEDELVNMNSQSIEEKKMTVDKTYLVSNKYLWFHGEIDGKKQWVNSFHTK